MNIDTILDHVTDSLAIIVIGIIALHSTPSYEVLAALATIALGKRYIAKK